MGFETYNYTPWYYHLLGSWKDADAARRAYQAFDPQKPQSNARVHAVIDDYFQSVGITDKEARHAKLRSFAVKFNNSEFVQALDADLYARYTPAGTPSALTRPSIGRPFEPMVARRLQQITGCSLTRDDLLKLYRELNPNLHWAITAVHVSNASYIPDDKFRGMRDNAVHYTINGVDHRGKTVVRLGRVLTRHPDQSLELHATGVFVLKNYRGLALTSRCEELEQSWLRQISKHPNTRMTLAAGWSANPNKVVAGREEVPPLVMETVGYYTHAVRGYLFADAWRSTLLTYPTYADANISDRLRLASAFESWLHQKAIEHKLLENGGALTPETWSKLVASVRACKYPSDFGHLQIPGVTLADAKMKPNELGRAFLTSGQAPYWNGVRFVNDARFWQRDRKQSEAVFRAQLAREKKTADDNKAAALQRLQSELASNDPNLRFKAVLRIGKRAAKDSPWQQWLTNLYQREPDAKVREGIQWAVYAIRGEFVRPLLRAAADDPENSEPMREYKQALLQEVAA